MFPLEEDPDHWAVMGAFGSQSRFDLKDRAVAAGFRISSSGMKEAERAWWW